MLAPAAVALALRIPIAHVEGGEISEGAIDDAVRNALTKMSHIHLTATENSRLRVLAMGEESWRVHRVGAPSLDHIYRQQLLTRSQMESALGVSLDRPTVIVTYHPVTISPDTTYEADALFKALGQLSQQIIFCYPNADAGGRNLIERMQSFCARRENAQLFINLPALKYWSLLKSAHLMVGNSSSGIMETPSLLLPTVNIGLRQHGRERARNVLDAAPEPRQILDQIERALSPDFADSLNGMTNPYGDGRAAERITEILTSVALDETLLRKRAVPIAGGGPQGSPEHRR
jgi:UDP-N-acetylglucosamine 2-epimerase (non-hydrolysing)/GDP/UDP-N,N'-diacetylbacillosamine 2-epimerase (hydrolysing)